MKKFFTLIVALVAAVSNINAEEIVLFDGDAVLGWGGTHIDCSAISASSDLTLNVTIETTTGDWWQYKFCQAVDGWPAIEFIGKEFVTANDVEFSWSAGTYKQSFELTEDMIAKMKSGVYVQGSISSGELHLKKVTVVSKVNYSAEGKNIEMDEYGQMLSSQFNGLSDDAKVEFTWTAVGSDGRIGWGSSSLASLDGSVSIGTFAIKGEGSNVNVYTLKDLKDALNAGPDQYGRYGLVWNMWNCDPCVNTRVSVIAYEVEGFEGAGYQDPVTSGISTVNNEVSNSSVRYNLAGQSVSANAKGIVIMNGKKFMVK